ncbi:hypothetical protein B0H16DRAFT_1886790 [Mycena metata]|uniref:Uncharacterized protein n=1 Tax=Mycena metata TaxID=1033252 RepID=A0AAD7J120_9AGAR|nr:hypothetical protein B0H16DRAFT_1886790 [Mycena metata]
MLSTVLAGFSDSVKNGLSATRTTEIILFPTKSVLSNSNISNPYVAAMGYATVILIALFLILRAKGFSSTLPCSPGPPPPPTPPSPEYPVPSASKLSPGGASPTHSHSGMGSEPPSPPPDPGSDSADDTPRRSPWWLLLLLVVLAAGSYLYFTRNLDSSVVLAKTLGSQIASTMEQCLLGISYVRTAAVSAISTASIYISRHGWHIAKILLLGLATHGVCFVVFVTIQRSRPFVRLLFTVLRAPIWSCSVSMVAIGSLPHLSWIMWMASYSSSLVSGPNLTARQIHWSVLVVLSQLSSRAASHFVELSTILGIIILHSPAICLQVVLLLFCGLHSVVVALMLDRVPPLIYLAFFVFVMAGITTTSSIWAVGCHYIRLHPSLKPLVWESFYCGYSRDQMHGLFGLFVERYRDWKDAQIEECLEFSSGFINRLLTTFKSLLEIWNDLPLSQKLLIAAPAIIFYGYLYIMPVARSIGGTVMKTRDALFATSQFSCLRHLYKHIPLSTLLAMLSPSYTHLPAPYYTPAGLAQVVTTYTRRQYGRRFIPLLALLKSSIDLYPPAVRPPYYTPAGFAQVV